MKPISEISPKYYGQARQFGSKKSEKWQKEVSWVKRTAWEESGDRDWEAVRWNQQEKETGDRQKSQHEKFQPEAGLATAQILSFPELDRETAPCWSSRSSPLGTGGDGSLRMYEGRLTRVREQVLREDEKSRDLGPERREKFTPREVEEMLSQPVGEFRGPVKGRTEEGSPPAVGGN